MLLRDDVPQTLWVSEASLAAAWDYVNGVRDDGVFLDTIGFGPDELAAAEEKFRRSGNKVGAVVNYIVAATSGHLYLHLRGKLSDYPIPNFCLEGKGESLLDIGCNWGRWTISASRAGFKVVGMDPSLGAVVAAKRLCESLGVEAEFVVGDARHIPFAPGTFDVTFSYSVVQHLSRSDAG